MEHVNGDMEDLFRRAAEKYPLRTDGADWDRLAAALDKDPGPPSDADIEDKRRRRGIFWWLLLPLVGALGLYIWHTTGTRPAGAKTTAVQATTAQAATPQASAPNTTASQATAAQPGATQATTGQADASQPAGAQPAGTAAQARGAAAQRGGTAAQPAGQAGSSGGTSADGRVSQAANDGSAGTPARRTRIFGSTGASARKKRPGGTSAKEDRVGANAGDTGEGSVAGDNRFDAVSKNPTGNHTNGNKGGSGNGTPGEAAVSRIDLRRVPTAGSYSVVVDVKAPAARKDSSAKQTKKATAKSNAGHGYIGLTGAPDFSTVKMQATKGVGTTWGLLLGYAFNKHWAVESGVSIDHKKYYSSGEYFYAKGDPSLPANANIQSVNGSCNMWEIPLNVRYTFNPGSKINWFATAGMSSYFMTKQQYAYQLENGTYTWARSWSTSTPANYPFSVINLSGGFEQRIGKIGNLRIEPYLRIPLSGIGSGRLPIMSGGLNIGITRQLW